MLTLSQANTFLITFPAYAGVERRVLVLSAYGEYFPYFKGPFCRVLIVNVTVRADGGLTRYYRVLTSRLEVSPASARPGPRQGHSGIALLLMIRHSGCKREFLDHFGLVEICLPNFELLLVRLI